MKPYYADDAVTLYHGDCRTVLPSLDDLSVDCVITDPPYSAQTHAGAQTGRDGGVQLVHFASVTQDGLSEILADCARVTNRWFVGTLDWRHTAAFADTPPKGWKFIRFGVWVKPDGAPQFTGDRPGPGWESICFMHRDIAGRMKWNGGGRSSAWIHKVARGDHPTQKPLGLVADWVRLFTNPGETILDPFAGSGTTLRAAKDNGRKAIGVELDEAYCEVIARRLAQEVLDFGEVS